MRTTIALVLAAAAAVGTADAAEVTGAGSSFVYPVMARWSADYARASGDRINYQSTGSGAGITQIKAGTIDFGATDQPLPPAELAAAGLAQFPVVIGGIVPVVNVGGIKPGTLRLSGAVLADIFAGRVKTWNDRAIAGLNPGMALPATAITIVHRSDGSGTTFNFTHYLGQVSPAFRAKFGEGKTVAWAGGIGGKGNEGVAAYVRQIPGSIGYVESTYVLQNRLTYALVQNSGGRFIAPNQKTMQAAAATAAWDKAADFNLVITNAPGPDAYPITATTFVLVYKNPAPAKKARTQAAIKFLQWSLANGGSQAAALNYVALPPALVKRVGAYIAANVR